MSQRQQLERILEIDRRIRAGQCPAPARLALDLEVSRRTLFNDRSFLVNRLGAPLRVDRKRGGWSYSDPSWSLPSVMVTEGELLAVLIGVEVARRYAGTAMERPLLAAVEKIARGLKGPVSIDLEEMRSRFSIADPGALGAEESILMGLQQAVRERRVLSIRYYVASRREETERTVEPHHLHNRAGEWYLLAWDGSRKAFRVFHAGRIRAMEILPRRFVPRPGAEEHLAQSFQILSGEAPAQVAILFDPEQAAYVRERRWHLTQVIEDQPDGGVLVRFTTTGMLGVLRWVLQYGRHAEVLHPASLRREVARETAAMAAKYAGKDGPPARSKRRKAISQEGQVGVQGHTMGYEG